MALVEHIYSSEDTLYQIIFDKKYQPELYRLKMTAMLDESRQESSKKSHDDFLKRYREVQERYRQRRLENSF